MVRLQLLDTIQAAVISSVMHEHATVICYMPHHWFAWQAGDISGISQGTLPDIAQPGSRCQWAFEDKIAVAGGCVNSPMRLDML
jgi:hypothetical protein